MTQEHRAANLSANINTCRSLLEELSRIRARRCDDTSQILGSEDASRYLDTLDRFVRHARKSALLIGDASAQDGFQHVPSHESSLWRESLATEFQKCEIEWDQILECLNIENDRTQDPVSKVITASLDAWHVLDGIFSEEEIQAAERFFNLAWVRPDEWLTSFDELQPVMATGIDRTLAEPFRQRLREIYRSYAIGNYFSVYALGRATLEIALKDKASSLGIDKTQKLSRLIDEFTTAVPELRTHMEVVKEAGDDTLHHKSNRTIPYGPESRRKTAKTVIESLRVLLENLYQPHAG